MPEAAGAGLLRLVAAAADTPEIDPNDVTPGPAGFIATFAVVIAVVLLMRDFSRRVRRLRLRGEAMEREAADRRAADPRVAQAPGVPPSSGPPEPPASRRGLDGGPGDVPGGGPADGPGGGGRDV